VLARPIDGTRPRAAQMLTTTLTTKEAHFSGKYVLRRTSYCTELLSVDGGGHESVELENRRRRKVIVGSNPTPSATDSRALARARSRITESPPNGLICECGLPRASLRIN
jgi:hypothetical protein